MKAADVRGCVEAIAGHVSLDPDDLLETATYEAGYEARSAAHKKEEVEREICQEGEGAHPARREDAREDKPLRGAPLQAALPSPARAREPPEAQDYWRGRTAG